MFGQVVDWTAKTAQDAHRAATDSCPLYTDVKPSRQVIIQYYGMASRQVFIQYYGRASRQVFIQYYAMP